MTARAVPASAMATITAMMNSTAAMAPATHGLKIAVMTTPTIATSSATDTATLLAGSGEVLTASRVVALARWVMRATAPPPAAITALGPLRAGRAILGARLVGRSWRGLVRLLSTGLDLDLHLRLLLASDEFFDSCLQAT